MNSGVTVLLIFLQTFFYESVFGKTSKRKFSHIRFIFLLIIVFNTLSTIIHNTEPLNLYKNHLEEDIKYCEKCFKTQLKQCHQIFKYLESEEEFSIRQLLNILPEGTQKRNNQIVILQNTTEKIIAKYLFKPKWNLKLNPDTRDLKRMFLENQKTLLNGMQYTPLNTIDEFINTLQVYHSNLPELTIWIYLLINIQPVLLPLLYELQFPVPKSYAVCGFTLFQHYAGLDLNYFYESHFHLKLKIAQQLLEASLKFSYGFDGYRFYITDLTADNVVYDVQHNKLTFIDLDTVFVVDSSQAKYKFSIHKHRYIECPGCFAYSPDDISSYNLSDINIYSTCQFLREDLYKQQSKGFLHPIPDEISAAYPSLWQHLNKCVDCPDSLCLERFTVAKDLIKLLQKML